MSGTNVANSRTGLRVPASCPSVPEMETVAAIVARNVGELRGRRQFSVRDLSRRLEELGTPMLASAISKIENGQRKVTVDELVALARALNVSPVRLLLPGKPDTSGDSAAANARREWEWHAMWRWAVGEEPLARERRPLTDPRIREFIRENRPFEDEASVREAAQFLLAREPVPFTAEISADSTGAVRSRITWGDRAEQGEDERKGGSDA